MSGYVYRGNQPETPERKKTGPVPLPYDPALCGTTRGFKQHERFGIPKCEACRNAYREYRRSLQAAKKVGV